MGLLLTSLRWCGAHNRPGPYSTAKAEVGKNWSQGTSPLCSSLLRPRCSRRKPRQRWQDKQPQPGLLPHGPELPKLPKWREKVPDLQQLQHCCDNIGRGPQRLTHTFNFLLLVLGDLWKATLLKRPLYVTSNSNFPNAPAHFTRQRLTQDQLFCSVMQMWSDLSCDFTTIGQWLDKTEMYR